MDAADRHHLQTLTIDKKNVPVLIKDIYLDLFAKIQLTSNEQ